MIGSNYTDDLKARGLTTPGSNTKIWDFNGGVGGPIKKDRLWFFYTLRDEGSHRTVPGMFANLNAGDPTKWTYVADPNTARRRGRVVPHDLAAAHRRRPRRATSSASSGMSRCRAKAPRGRARPARACRQSGDNEIIAGGTAAPTPAASATAAPETAAYRDYGTRFRQVSWQSPMTSRLLLEAGVGNYASRYLGDADAGHSRARLHPGHGTVRRRVRGQRRHPEPDVPGRNHRARTGRASNNWRASLSYVEGKHSMKFGYQGGYLMDDRFPYTNSQFMTYRMNNGSAGSDQRDHRLQPDPAARPLRRVLRAGPVDDGPDHAAGRAAVRSRVEHLPGGHDRRRPLPADGHVVPGNQGRRCVQGPDAARRRRDRSLRRRQDGAQVQLRPLPRGGAERRPVHRQPSDLARSRRRRRARGPTRTATSGPTATCRTTRRRICARAAATSAAPSRTPTSASRSSTRRRIRRCSPAGASGPATGSGARRFSSRWCRACRSRSATSAAGC